ncbi:hypothetical protein Hte_009696 [Hypoxylon texense]
MDVDYDLRPTTNDHDARRIIPEAADLAAVYRGVVYGRFARAVPSSVTLQEAREETLERGLPEACELRPSTYRNAIGALVHGSLMVKAVSFKGLCSSGAEVIPIQSHPKGEQFVVNVNDTPTR